MTCPMAPRGRWPVNRYRSLAAARAEKCADAVLTGCVEPPGEEKGEKDVEIGVIQGTQADAVSRHDADGGDPFLPEEAP